LQGLQYTGKRDDFTRAYFYSLEPVSPLFTRNYINETIDNTIEQVSRWCRLSVENNVPELFIKEVEGNLQLEI